MFSNSLIFVSLVFCFLSNYALSFHSPLNRIRPNNKLFSGVTETPGIFNHLGDIENPDDGADKYGRDKKAAYNMNVGHALETIRRELPMAFVLSEPDFSIFANTITVGDGNQNKMVMPKSLYSGAVKSIRIASTWSSIYPSMNVRSIEYSEDSSTISCLVDVVLPDSVRVDGQAVWEGYFYFGLDGEGRISSHVMDRKISNLKPSPMHTVKSSTYPWLRPSAAAWSSDLLVGAPTFSSSRVPSPQEVAISEIEDSLFQSSSNEICQKNILESSTTSF